VAGSSAWSGWFSPACTRDRWLASPVSGFPTWRRRRS
jgi:hypothetical protein